MNQDFQERLKAVIDLLMDKVEFKTTHEICLPSGKFVAFREVYAVDVMAALQGMTQPINPTLFYCKILSRVCRVDEEEKDIPFFLNLPMTDYYPIQAYISAYIERLNAKGVG